MEGDVTEIELPVVGPGGEPIDLKRTFLSHGLASLAPMAVDDGGAWFEVTLRLATTRPRTVRVQASSPGCARLTVRGEPIDADVSAEIVAQLRQILRLDEDLSGFYRKAERDKNLAWVATGAGRMIRSQTVFEDVVKTICTTNCTWSATRRMIEALVAHLGEAAVDALSDGVAGFTFPTPQAMAGAGSDFYSQTVRAGYRGAYLQKLARMVVDGEIDLERYGWISQKELPDDDLAKELLALPGVGPYATSHIMMMLGRYSRPILDSWTRPTYARLLGKEQVDDADIEKRFRRYKQYAGLAFWLFVTRDWISESDITELD
jgi:3-methyladenine DNA glycosylase/8-oxoguanine DNA glycosylase